MAEPITGNEVAGLEYGYLPDGTWGALPSKYNTQVATQGKGLGANQYQNPYVDDKGNMTGYGQIQTGLGLGQLGLGVVSYLDNRKTAKKNRELMNQQIASNRAEMANTAAFRQGLAKQFGTGV